MWHVAHKVNCLSPSFPLRRRGWWALLSLPVVLLGLAVVALRVILTCRKYLELTISCSWLGHVTVWWWLVPTKRLHWPLMEYKARCPLCFICLLGQYTCVVLSFPGLASTALIRFTALLWLRLPAFSLYHTIDTLTQSFKHLILRKMTSWSTLGVLDKCLLGAWPLDTDCSLWQLELVLRRAYFGMLNVRADLVLIDLNWLRRWPRMTIIGDQLSKRR